MHVQMAKISLSKLLKIIFALHCLCIGMSTSIEAQKHHDLVVMLGHEYDAGILTAILAQAIHDQSYPVLVSGQALSNYLAIAEKSANIAMAQKVKKQVNKRNIHDQEVSLDKIVEIYKKKYGEGQANNIIEEFQICFIKKLSNVDWYGYHVLRQNLVLLLPMSYIRQHADPSIIDPDNQVRACGFNVGTKEIVRINDMRQHKLADKILKNRLSAIKKPCQKFIDGVKPLFITTKKSRNTGIDTADVPRWNIYITGHGGAAYVETKSDSIAQLTFARDFSQLCTDELFPSRKRRIKDMLIGCQRYLLPPQRGLTDYVWPSQKTGGDYFWRPDKKLLNTLLQPGYEFMNCLWQTASKTEREKKKKFIHGSVDWIEYYNNKIARLEKVIDQIDDQKSAFLASSCVIAGIPFDDFVDLMRFFNEEIDTSFVHYSTCFAGGRNRTFINKALDDLNVDFIIANVGTSELAVSGYGLFCDKFIVDEKNNISLQFLYNFKNFFSLLQEYCEQRKSRTPHDLGKMGDIIKNVICSNQDIIEMNNQPFVRMPQSKTFKAIDVDDSIEILTPEKIKNYALRKAKIDVSDKKAILVYPAYVHLPLKLGEETFIMSGLEPKIVSNNCLRVSVDHQIIQFFETIIYEKFSWGFINNFVRYNAVNNKVFLINELTSDCNTLEKIILRIFVQPHIDKPLAGYISINMICENDLHEIRLDCTDVSQPSKQVVEKRFIHQSETLIEEHLNTFDEFAARVCA